MVNGFFALATDSSACTIFKILSDISGFAPSPISKPLLSFANTPAIIASKRPMITDAYASYRASLK